MHIVIIYILNPKDVAVLMDMVSKVQIFFTLPGLDIGLVGPVARRASRFENLLAPQKTYWPGGQCRDVTK